MGTASVFVVTRVELDDGVGDGGRMENENELELELGAGVSGFSDVISMVVVKGASDGTDHVV